MKPRQSIVALYLSFFIFIVVVISILSVSLIYRDIDDYSKITRANKIMKVNSLLFQSVRNFGFERGRVNVVLNYQKDMKNMEKNIEFINEKREEGENAIKEALLLLDKLQISEKHHHIKIIQSLKSIIDINRETYQSEFMKPYMDRDKYFVDKWFKNMSSYIENITKLALKLNMNINDVSDTSNALITITANATMLRDNAGPVCSYLAAGILSRASISNHKIIEITERKVLSHNNLLMAKLSASNIDLPVVKSAIKHIETIYYGEFQEMIDNTMHSLKTGDPFKYSQKEFTKKAVQALESIANLADISNKTLEDSLSEQILDKQMSLLGHIFLILIMFIFLIYATRLLNMKIYNPIKDLISILTNLSKGKLDIQIPDNDRNDEIGDLVNGVIKFKSVQESLLKMNTELETIIEKITNQRTKEIKKEMQDLQLILDSIPVIIFIKDCNNNYLMGNREAAIFLGTSPENFQKASAETYFKDDSARIYKDDLRVITSKTADYKIIQTLPNSNNEKRILQTSKIPLFDESGEVAKILAVSMDITDEIEAQKQKLKTYEIMSNQAKRIELGNMIGAIVHQWKQPISIISLIIQETQYMVGNTDNIPIKNELLENLKHLLDNIKFMNDTSNDFTNFFKPSKNKESFHACDAFSEIYNMFKKSYINSNISFYIEPHEHISIYGYKNEMKQVALNLLNNSRDAFLSNENNKNKWIKVSIANQDDYAVITVSDNAGGIPQSLLPDKLFEVFESTKEDKGTGIGLNICKVIIESRFNGNLTAENSGEGAVFTIKIKLSDEADNVIR